jgi:glycine/D-amino acid oxidase-like deaminating enzyme
MKKVAIVGGGILGLAIGYELSKSKSKYRISIFEKESMRLVSINQGIIVECFIADYTINLAHLKQN